MNKAIYVAVVITAIGLAIAIVFHSQSDRFVLINGSKGNVYRLDSRTGEAVLIRGSRLIPVIELDPWDEFLDVPRELTESEIEWLDGRAGVSGDYCSGTLYNGNLDLDVVELKIRVSSNVDGRTVVRIYSTDVLVKSQTAADFGFSILEGNIGTGHDCSIGGAKGRLAQ